MAAPETKAMLMGDGGRDIRSNRAGDGLDDQIDQRPFHGIAPLV
jgi:hypothetical protein